MLQALTVNVAIMFQVISMAKSEAAVTPVR